MTSLLALLLIAAAPPDAVKIPAQSEILKTLRPGHPRLVGLPGDLERVKKLIAEDPRAGQIYKDVNREADRCLTQKPIQHRLIGPRLLDQSRTCLRRVYTLATVYRIGGDRRYADRAIREMLTAAAFDDWNPSHFLDTAEMTHALAIGYDWLYDVLTPAERATIRKAIVEKGLREAEKIYRKRGWWSASRHNWNQVCNGGISLGALAVAEDEPKLAAYIVHQAVQSVQRAMAEFAPDGAWAEGPGYWNYATSYNVSMLAGLESALGSDFGLSQFPGFSTTGDFRIHFVAPTHLAFAFADSSSGAGQAPQMYWLARKFDKPLLAWHEREYVGGASVLALWWFDPRGGPPNGYPTDRHFRHVDVVMMRSRWNDPDAVFVGFKAGDNKVNHSHLELGNFLLDAAGQRWAIELGADDYNLPAYFGNKRWTYYRLGTAGHNTLLIDGKNQDPKAVAPIVAFLSTPARAHAVADLTAAYRGQATKVRRGIALIDRRQVLVQDEIEGAAGSEITWQMHTRAEIQLDGARAVLGQGGKRLVARILSPADAVFTTAAASAPPPQRQQPDVTKLIVRLPGSEGPLRLAVVFAADGSDAKAPALAPLQTWTNGVPAPQ
jgi:hypothetical protein